MFRFQSTHPSRGATVPPPGCCRAVWVSIHAPLAGCDPFASMMMPLRKMFQSTHPSRGATGNLQHMQETIEVSIHAPLAGCDPAAARMLADDRVFQSTHPSRGAAQQQRSAADVESVSIHAPLAGCDKEYERGIERLRVSIHAPLAGCDPRRGVQYAIGYGFNPRTPRGVRLTIAIGRSRMDKFQSTHPSRGATAERLCLLGRLPVSIHAPLAGCDPPAPTGYVHRNGFNPRTPRGVRLKERNRILKRADVSIHAPLAGCDASPVTTTSGLPGFNPRTPRGVRPALIIAVIETVGFQSTHPSRGATFRQVLR